MMTEFKRQNISVYVVESYTYLHVTDSYRVRYQLRQTLKCGGLLIWECQGMFGFVPPKIIENALTPGCAANITWEQTVHIGCDAAKLLLQHAQEFSESSEPSETAPSGKRNKSESEG